jgi:hypothetical protein
MLVAFQHTTEDNISSTAATFIHEQLTSHLHVGNEAISTINKENW